MISFSEGLQNHFNSHLLRQCFRFALDVLRRKIIYLDTFTNYNLLNYTSLSQLDFMQQYIIIKLADITMKANCLLSNVPHYCIIIIFPIIVRDLEDSLMNTWSRLA